MKRALPLLCAAVLAACGSTPRRDLDYDRLHASLQALAADPELARLALAERTLAEAAVRRLDASSINASEHAQLAYLAERRVDIAYIAAQTEREAARLSELQREHASLLLAASRRETAAVRAELDRQRQRELLLQEAAERRLAAAPDAVPPPATTISAMPPAAGTAPPGQTGAPLAAQPSTIASAASTGTPEAGPTPVAVNGAPAGNPSATADPASPLAQRLATLAPDAGDGSQVTLEDLVFEPGTATLAGDAPTGIARVAAWVAAAPAQSIRIEGHTDATGSAEANLNLSLRRAEAVRDALIARGVRAARIQVAGAGSAQPVASNDDAAGRAQNRRVVVRLVAD